MKRKQFIAIIAALAVLAEAGTANAARYIGLKKMQYTPSTGIVDTIVIPVQFPDLAVSEEEVGKLQEQFYGEGYDENDQYRSLSTYYANQSQGNLEIKGTVLPLYQTQYSEEMYNQPESSQYFDALTEAILYYVQQGVDFSQYDLNGNGCIDHIFIKVPSEYRAHYRGTVGSHLSVAGVSFIGYSCSPYQDIHVDAEGHTDCHEFGHALGLTDYYGWDKQYLLGDELMASPIGYINVYEKYILEWLEPLILSGQGLREVTISRQELAQADHPQAVIIIPDEALLPFTEFYMLEYRKNGKVYVWRLDAAIHTYLTHTQFGEMPHGDYKKWGYGADDYYLNGVTAADEPGVLVSQDNYPADGNFTGTVFTGTYIELLETTPDTATLRVGLEENNGIAPVLQETNVAPGSFLEPSDCSFLFTYDTAVQAEGRGVLEEVSSGDQQWVSYSANGNVVSVDLVNKVTEGAEYRLTLPVVTDAAGNAAGEYTFSFHTKNSMAQKRLQRRRWELKELQPAQQLQAAPPDVEGLVWQGDQLYFEKTNLGEMERSSQTTVSAQPDGCSVILSQRKGGWLGYSYPVLSKVSDEGVLLWQSEYDGLGGEAPVLGADLSKRRIYVQTAAGSKLLQFYEEEEPGEALSVNHPPGRYREPVRDLTLCVPEDSTVFYTLDGSDPRFYGIPYTAPLALPRSCKLRAVAKKEERFGREFSGDYYFTSDPGRPSMWRRNQRFSAATANDGSFRSAGRYIVYPEDYFDFSDFSDLVSAEFCDDVFLGIRSDGSVVATGEIADYGSGETIPNAEFGEVVAAAQDIIQIEELHTALQKDGTIYNWWWRWLFEETVVQPYQGEIVQIAYRLGSLYLLREDGTVVRVENEAETTCGEELGWKEIVGIWDYYSDVIGLDRDGTVWYYSDRYHTTTKVWENMESVQVTEKISGITATGQSVYLDSLSSTDSYQNIQAKTEPLFQEAVKDILWCGSAAFGLRGDGTLAVVNKTQYEDVVERENWNLLPERSVEILPEHITLHPGESQRLLFDFDWIDRKTIVWTASGNGVVRVEADGRVTAQKPGTATVTARSAVDPDVQDTVTVTVEGTEMPCSAAVQVDSDGMLQVSVKSASFTGDGHLLAGCFKDGRLVATKTVPLSLTAGETKQVTVPAARDCDEVRLYVWGEDLRPLAYPEVVWPV